MILKNRTVWLIGASSGIGAALAPALARAGAILALSARREAELHRVAEACPGDRPLVRPLDVTDGTQVEAVYSDLVSAWGRVDVVIYGAAASDLAPADEFDTERALHQIDVAYLGLVRVIGAVLPDMVTRGSGEVVGIASLAGYAGFPWAPEYTSAKAAIVAYLQALRVRLRPTGVGVVTVSPGFVKTAMTENNRIPMPFLLTPDQAAEAIVKGLLAGDAEIHFPKRLSWPAKFITGLPRPVFEWLVGMGFSRRR